MRFVGALVADIKFQAKQGFYFIYVFITILYMVLLSVLPKSLLGYVVPGLVFSDPTIIGFFFIGGILMLEKEQDIIRYLYITPLRISEYILSKVVSLSILAVVAGTAITLTSNYDGYLNLFIVSIGIFMSSVFFILIGVLTSIGCNNLNQYIARMIPLTAVLMLPCASLLDFQYNYLFNVFPSVLGLRLMLAGYYPQSILYIMLLLVVLCGLNGLIFIYTMKAFTASILKGGH